MRKRPKYDIFISYRRIGGFETAKHLYDLLARDGYRVSFDIDSLRDGNFDEAIFNIIDSCKDFVLIVDEKAFDRTLEGLEPKDDWLRQELARALKKELNVIPIFLNGVQGFPNGLPEDINEVTKKNGPEYSSYYFDDFYSKLKEQFIHSKPVRHEYRSMIILLSIIICLISFLFATYNKPNTSNLPELNTTQVNNVHNLIWHSPLGLASYSGPINKDSMPNGKGDAIILDGELKGSSYSGMFKDGVFEGECNYRRFDGDIFNGIFRNNEYYKGKYISAGTDSLRYEGYFRNGQPIEGILYNNNGDTLKLIHDIK